MGKDSSFSVGILRFANQVLIVVKQSALRLPTRALLLWGNLSRDQLLKKARCPIGGKLWRQSRNQ